MSSAARHAAQRDAERDSRLRPFSRARAQPAAAGDVGAAVDRSERERRIAELTRYIDDVAGARTAPRSAVRRAVRRRVDAKRARTARRVATDQLDVVLARQRDEAEHERTIHRGSAAGSAPASNTNRGNAPIAASPTVDGERLVAERPADRRQRGMPALDEHVDRHYVFHAGRRREDGAVVADADADVALRGGARK